MDTKPFLSQFYRLYSLTKSINQLSIRKSDTKN